MKLSTIFQKLRDVLIDGLVTILPISITVYLLWLGYNLIDRVFGRGTMLGSQLSRSLQRLFGVEWIPGLSVIYTVIVVLILGLVSRIYLGKLVRRYFGMVLKQVPIVKRIYPPAQEVSEAVLGRGDFSSFKEAVLLEYPRPDSYTIGFVTNHIGEKVAVYIFSAPNPFSGKLLILPEQDITYLDMTVEEGMKMVISGGISSPGAADSAQNLEKLAKTKGPSREV